MKATAVKEAEVFQPITLTMQIESADELAAFQELFGCDKTIPAHLEDTRDITFEQRVVLSKAFGTIYNLIQGF